MALTSTQVANQTIANQNAIGQYGNNRNNALVGNSIGTSNSLGQMASGYFNAMGQLGTAAGAYGQAGQAAAANTNRGNAVGGILGGLSGGQQQTGKRQPQAQFDNKSMMSFFNNTRDVMGARDGFADKARQNVYSTGVGARQDIMSPDIMQGLNAPPAESQPPMQWYQQQQAPPPKKYGQY